MQYIFNCFYTQNSHQYQVLITIKSSCPQMLVICASFTFYGKGNHRTTEHLKNQVFQCNIPPWLCAQNSAGFKRICFFLPSHPNDLPKQYNLNIHLNIKHICAIYMEHTQLNSLQLPLITITYTLSLVCTCRYFNCSSVYLSYTFN